MESRSVTFTVNGRTGSSPLTLDVRRLVCCGWVGRDRAALEAHIEELAGFGIPRPTRVPIYMNYSSYLLTQDDEVTVVTGASSGEVEFVLLCRGRETWVTVGSDQTDREVEKTSIPISKQMCGKYLAKACWPYEEVSGHWDRLVLRCWVTHGGIRRLYQEATVAAILPPEELIRRLPDLPFPPAHDSVLYSGTIPTKSGLVFGDRYEIELEDPELKRTISGSYSVRVLAQHL